MNEISSKAAFGPSAEGQGGSRGIIFSDCNGTLVGLNDGTKFFKEYAVYLKAMQHSGYTVILHSLDMNGNAGLLPSQFLMSGTRIKAEDFAYDGLIVSDKREDTKGMKGIVAFDDDQGSHYVEVDHKFDTNDPFTKAGIMRIAAEFEASGRTKKFTFNPDDFKAPEPGLNVGSPDVTGPR